MVPVWFDTTVVCNDVKNFTVPFAQSNASLLNNKKKIISDFKLVNGIVCLNPRALNLKIA